MADKKIAFITGGNRGLGRETARELGEMGILVVIGSRDSKKGETTAAELRARGIAAESVKCDVTRSEDHRSVYEYFERKHGKLDILVNNAGIRIDDVEDASAPGGSRTIAASELPMTILRETFEANFFATVALTQTLLPLVRKAPAGRIVNLSSILASLTLHSTPGSPIYDAKALAYDASKTALNAFTVHLAYELRDTPINVNSAHPGWVKTEMGGPNAEIELSEGGKTSAQLATLPADGPSGGFFHLGRALPW